MSGLFSTLYTANKGLQSNQTALHTASHNISNANSRGYTRQRVELKADLAYSLGGVGQLGTGVKMDSIVRLVDDYVTKQIRTESGTLERYAAKSDAINRLEVIFNEPSKTGLNFYLSEMFDSWQELSMYPESLNSKTIIVEKSKALAETINHMSSQIDSLKGETIEQLEKNALDFNSIVDELETLNEQILNISLTGQVPNDLLDQRDLMLQDLSTISNFKASFDQYNRVSISIGDNNIIGGENQVELSVVTSIVENQDGTFDVAISRGGDGLSEPEYITVDNMDDYQVGKVLFTNKEGAFDQNSIKDSEGVITSGRIQGNKEAIVDIENSLKNLGQFAKMMADAINTIHTDGNGEGGDYYNFFTYDETNPSLSIKVNDSVQEDHSLVWVSKELVGPDTPEGDGSRALAIARLRNAKLLFNESGGFDYDEDSMEIKDKTGGITIENAYGNIVINIGISKEHSDNVIANQDVLLGQLEMKRESTSGVSINEEISNVIKFQKSYEANARVIQALTEMLDVLINRTGV